jgi:hypothetical protein
MPYLIGIICICLTLIKTKNEKNYLFNRLLIFFYILFSIVLFYSIRPTLWYTDRYKAEYLGPFVILGAYLLFCKLIENFNKYILVISALVLIALNVYGYSSYKNELPIGVSEKFYKRDTQSIYDYRTALIQAKKDGYANSIIFVGNTNAEIPFILSGYTTFEVKNIKEIIKLQFQSDSDWTSVNVEMVNDSKLIDLVLISDTSDRDLRDKFVNIGWREWKNFKSNDGFFIYGLKRP